jgi:hypothetical protein
MIKTIKLIAASILFLFAVFGNFNSVGTIAFGLAAVIFYLEYRLDGKVDKADLEEQIIESDIPPDTAE